MMIAAVMGAMLMSAIPGVTAEARGQSLGEDWEEVAVGDPFDSTKDAEGVALATWYDAGQNKIYVFVTGWAFNDEGGVCIVTYKLDPSDEGTVVRGPVFFPPGSPTTETLIHKPTAITVDGSGNVYVTGFSQNGNGDYDYILLKYDSELEPDDGWQAISPDPVSVRRFNGAGDDKAVAVVVAECDSTPLVVVTGTSRGQDNNDIVTIAYNRNNGNIVWTDSYNGAGDGNDFAVAMAVVASTSPENEPPLSIIVAGTTYGGSTVGFDILALRYSSCGSLLWDLAYNNGLVDGDDVCTDLVVINGASGTQTGIFLIGSTPHYPASPGDTDYVALAIRMTGVLSDAWQSNGFGDGVRMWNPGVGTSDDAPVAATIAGGVLVVTGRVQSSEEEGSPYDIGTIAYSTANGAVVDSLIFGEGGEGGVDVRASAIIPGYFSNIVYITGWYYAPIGDTPFYYLTIKLQVDPMDVVAQAYLSGEGDDAKARDVVRLEPAPIGDKGICVTGRLGIPQHGVKIGTMKYIE